MKVKSLCVRNWNDLSYKNRIIAFMLLGLLMKGEISPDDFQLHILHAIYDKYPKRTSGLKKWIIRIFTTKKYFQQWLEDDEFEYELSEFIYVRSAEELKFAFNIDGNKIIPNYNFRENPFPEISETPPTFTRNYTIDSNITAKQFSDCIDIVREMDEDIDNKSYKHLLVKIVEILYNIDYAEASKIRFEILFGISYWFKGIALFFQTHPIYSVLFSGNKSDDEEKIHLGMSETILHLMKEGYPSIENMNIIDFFNAQIKLLKDNISASLAAGVKIEEIMQRTGLDYHTINKLS